MSPITPSQIKAAIVGPFSSICSKLESLFNVISLYYSEFFWKYNEDGSFTDDYKAFLCSQLTCAGGTGGGTGGGGTGTEATFGPPTIKASWNAYTDATNSPRIVISWTQIAQAAKYYIYRSVNAAPLPTDYIGYSTSLAYNDTSAVAETNYNYWAKSVKADGTISDYSAMATGRCRAATPPVNPLQPPAFFDIRNEADSLVIYWAAVGGTPTITYILNWIGESGIQGSVVLPVGTTSYNTHVPARFSGPTTVPTRSFTAYIQAVSTGAPASARIADTYMRIWTGTGGPL